jgi:23S rRNA (guanine745-N1)-methyltransferase
MVSRSCEPLSVFKEKPVQLRCPVCKEPLEQDDRGALCTRGHCFNRAREGYLNLLRSSRPGNATGDPKGQARSRHDFLDRGYYEPLRAALTELAGRVLGGLPSDAPRAVLDICCGEGYYTSALGRLPGVEACGFDLSKEMVRLAAKRGGAAYVVANMKDVPVSDASFGLATCLFAPFDERETARVLHAGGELVVVVPGRRHLWGLKRALYATPYENDEALPPTTLFEPVETLRVTADVELASPQDVEAVFQMTPYYYRTSAADRAKLAALPSLSTPVEFVLTRFRRAR